MRVNKINEIDLLRFIAAISVVFFHLAFGGYATNTTIMPYDLLSSISKYGRLGVELFFMISGFVILLTVSNNNIKNFIISRIVRLYPTFWICCTITFLFIIIFGKPFYFASFYQYIINLTMFSRLLGVDYIDVSYWTLLIEMQFYIMIGIILVLNQIRRVEKIITAWLIICIILNINSFLPFIFNSNMLLYRIYQLLIIEYAPFFIAGMTYFLIWSKGLSFNRFIIIIFCWLLSLSNLLDKVSWFENHYKTGINYYIAGSIITVFFIAMMLIALKKTWIFKNSNFLLLGSLSYPIYLLNQNIGFVIFNNVYKKMNSHLIFWFTIFFILILSYLVSIFVEKYCSKYFKLILNNIFI
ncbi:MAG: hypothetical protein RLZZ210_971 [Pseudomonadota bacterium]|jgi:peptidoglycan/LPS O-acetylase OafA/YrhL